MLHKVAVMSLQFRTSNWSFVCWWYEIRTSAVSNVNIRIRSIHPLVQKLLCGADTRADGLDIISFVMKEDKWSSALMLRFVLLLTMRNSRMWHFFLYYNQIVQSQCDRLILSTGEGFIETFFFCTPVAIFVAFLQLSFACTLCYHDVSFWISQFFFNFYCKENGKRRVAWL